MVVFAYLRVSESLDSHIEEAFMLSAKYGKIISVHWNHFIVDILYKGHFYNEHFS